jgi:hypothetical protein
MPFAANNSVGMGPIQSMGAGKTVPAARCFQHVHHLLPTYSVLSSNRGQSVERSCAVASDEYIGTTIGSSTGDASDAAAKTERRHTT